MPRPVVRVIAGTDGGFIPSFHFGVRRTAPVWGPCDCLQLGSGGADTEPIFVYFLCPEATAVWQWFHFLQGQVPPGRPVLRLNLDENSIKFWYEVFAKIVRELGKVLRARAGGRQAILLLDAHFFYYV